MSKLVEAMELLEQYKDKEAFQLLQEAARLNRGVNELNNLAWFYLYEEDFEQAKVLLQEVVAMKPASHFPYNMLGEMALREERYEAARDYLKKALRIYRSKEAVHNLAVVLYRIGEFAKSAELFSEVAYDSSVVKVLEAVAWLRAGEVEITREILYGWNDEANYFSGFTGPADVLLELGDYEEACTFFAREWEELGYSGLYIVNRYMYALYKNNDIARMDWLTTYTLNEIDQQLFNLKEDLTKYPERAVDLSERMVELEAEQEQVRKLAVRIQNGFVPALEVEFYPEGGCYLFGCPQHRHAFYEIAFTIKMS